MRLPPPVPLEVLVSFHYFAKEGPLLDALARGGARMIGDSGAFSASTQGARIDLDTYAQWISVRGRFTWAANLDVIGNVEGSWANYVALTHMGLDVVPTIHYGTDPRAMDRYVDRGVELIGLGGMAGRMTESGVLRWLVSVFRYARDAHPHVRFHGWGLTTKKYLDVLPFWSVDSSSFGSSYRYGRLMVFDPAVGALRTVPTNGAAAGALGRLLRTLYGVNARELATSSAVNRGWHVAVAAHSATRMGQWYRARRPVDPPKGQHLTGLRVHYADSSLPVFHALLNYLSTGVAPATTRKAEYAPA